MLHLYALPSCYKITYLVNKEIMSSHAPKIDSAMGSQDNNISVKRIQVVRKSVVMFLIPFGFINNAKTFVAS